MGTQVLHRLNKQFRDRATRAGNVIVLAAAGLVMTFAFVAFTVDVGFITVTKAQIQAAVDGGALAGALEFEDGLGAAPEHLPSVIEANARAAAEDVASRHKSGNLDSVYVDQQRDIRFGQYQWNDTTEEWETTWGAAPYNAIEVWVHRNRRYFESQGHHSHYDFDNGQWVYDGYGSDAEPNSGDSELPLFFGPIIGHPGARVSTTATAAMLPGVGFRVRPDDANANVLPIALDIGTWTNLMNGIGNDEFSYDHDTEQIASGVDGVLEINLYPAGSSSLPPGNRGTLDFGSSNNSTNDLKRQIADGLNASDLSYFGGELRTDQGPISVNGDTGLSAGIKAELEAIKGEPRAIAIFTEVSGPGNNAYYTIVQFVGIRILDVKLTGGNKHVTVQPAVVVDRNVIPGSSQIADTSIFAPPRLVK